MQLAAPMLVRNTRPQPVVFSDIQNPSHYIEFAGAGDPNQGDLQIVPAEMGNTVNFRRALNLGLLKIEEEDETQKAALASQKAEWDAREAARNNSAVESMDMTPENDMVMTECIGPATRQGEALCGQPIPQTPVQQGSMPPLCTMHAHLTAQFVAQKTGRYVGNREEIAWVRAQGQG